MSSTRTISIYLLKPGITAAHQALKEEFVNLREHSVEAGETVGTLFVNVGEESSPDWVTFLNDSTQPPLDDKTQSLAAALLLEASGRWFAITFGYGRRLIDPDSYERDFGLRCALNGVDPKLLRGAEARTFDDYALHTLKQLSRLSSLSSLELNTERELVVSLAGKVDDPELAKRMDGRDAVRITAELEPAGLNEKCGDLLRLSEKTDYRQHFPFFDTIQRVSDPQEIDRLEKVAFSALGQQRFSEFDLYPPQIVSEEIVSFRYMSSARKPTEIGEPDHSVLRHVIRGPQGPARVKAELERFHLKGVDGNGEVVDEWPLLRCLHWEREVGGSVFVLDGGDWYRIEQSLVTDVEGFVKELKPSGIQWPAAAHKQREEDYNSDAAAARGFALLDKQLVRLSGQTPIEPCDLFTGNRQFVHVKHRKGGSKPLSHLFAQSVVSAQCFTLEPQFREQLQEKLEAALPGFGVFSPETIDTRDYAVILAFIATPSAKTTVVEGLPFFSKVMLRLTVRQLTSMGYEVFVDAIDSEPLPRVQRAARAKPSKRAPRAAPKLAPRPKTPSPKTPERIQ